MIIDKLGTFANNLALNLGAAANYNLGDVYDLGTGTPAMFNPDDIFCVLRVRSAITSVGAATVNFQLISDSNAVPDLTYATEVVHWQSGAIAKASLVAGYIIGVFELPRTAPGTGATTYKRYLGIQTLIGTAALTAGAIDAFLTRDAALATAFKAGTQ